MRERPITSRNNPAIRRMRALTHPHARRRADTFLVEGPKFVREALGSGFEVIHLVASEGYRGRLPRAGPEVKVLRVPEQLFREISDTASPQGLIAHVRRRWAGLAELTGSKRHLLVAWGVQDPGNVGTLIRSAGAFGLGGLIAGAGSADPFGPKAVRASAGAVLQLPLARAGRLERLLEALRGAGYSTYWTGTRAALALADVPRSGALAVFVGSEGRGFSRGEREVMGTGVRIPIAAQVESLNAGVVGSIVAYELAGQIEQRCD